MIYNYSRHFVDKADLIEVTKSLKGELITGGSYLKKFEKSISRKVHSKYTIAVNNGTSALILSIKALELKKKSRVIVPNITFSATASSVLHNDFQIYLCDIDYHTGQISTLSLNKLINSYPKNFFSLLINVDMRGVPLNYQEIFSICNKNKIKIIVDGCHSFGSSYKSRNRYCYVGENKHSELTTFSFHAVKNITAGEGGAITTKSYKIYKKLLTLRNQGIIRKNYQEYDIRTLTSNYRISEINCALGYSQLKKLNKFKLQKLKIINYYNLNFENFYPLIKTFENTSLKNVNYHLYCILVDFKKLKITKENFLRKMLKSKILIQVHYKPISELTIYKNNAKFEKKNLKNSYKYSHDIVSLPLYYTLKKIDISYICKTILNILNIR